MESVERDEETLRRQRLERLRERGFSYPNQFRPDALAADLHARYDTSTKEQLEADDKQATVAGRILSRRIMGKASFLTLRDRTATLQCYLRRDDLGDEKYSEFDELWDIGDTIGVTGQVFKTNRGELSLYVHSAELLSKALHPIPDSFYGLADQELRYRQRYVDLIVNDRSREVFQIRAKVIQEIRKFLEERDFMEVETPMMHLIPGGATAKPFKTHHETLDLDLYLRIAPELFLKRSVVGGLERVYEINRNFRNEGLSTRHNPEFTMLEFYQSYATFEDLMDLTESMFATVVAASLGRTEVEFDGETIDFGQKIRRVSMLDAVAQHFELEASTLGDFQGLKALADRIGLESEESHTWGYLLNEIFEASVERTLIQPTFVTHHPVDISPLARMNDANPQVTDRFELFVAAREIANGFSELNDPADQARRFQEQARRADEGDEEAMQFDSDYINALEYGLPPTAGEGVGIDRLVMLLTGNTTIRDVLLFPLLKPLR